VLSGYPLIGESIFLALVVKGLEGMDHERLENPDIGLTDGQETRKPF